MQESLRKINMPIMIRENFIHVLRDYLSNKKTDVFISDDLLNYAKIHQVQGIFYYQTGCKALEQAYYQELYYNRRFLALKKEIGEILELSEIKYFWVKGLDIASLYPRVEHRTMGDLDIVVDDIEKACEILKQHGFEFGHHDQCEWPCYKNGLRVELQSRLAYSGLDKSIAFFDTCWNYVEDHELDINYHFIYLIEHLRKHIVHGGVGFRQFMDIAVVIQKQSEIMNWEWIQGILVKLELNTFADNVFALIYRWFGVVCPLSVKSISDTLYDFATDRVLECGVFGYDSSETRKLANISLERSSEKNSIIALGKRLKEKVFPGYHQLIVWDEYSFLEGRKYLLPICWVYRIVLKILIRRKNVFVREDRNINQKLYEKKNKELRLWGL